MWGRLSTLPEITQLLSGRAKRCTQAAWPQTLGAEKPLCSSRLLGDSRGPRALLQSSCLLGLPSCEVAMMMQFSAAVSRRSPSIPEPSHPEWRHSRTKLCTLPPSRVWKEPSEPRGHSGMAGKTGKFRARPDALLSLWRVMKKQASSMLTERGKKKRKCISIMHFCAVGTISTSLV